LANCRFCSRPTWPGQKQCACGAVLPGGGGAADIDLDPKPTRTGSATQTSFDFGSVVPWIPLFAFLLLLMWVLPLHPGRFPGTKLFKTYAIMAIATGMFALLDLQRAVSAGRKLKDSPLPQLSPVTWFAAIVFAWPIAFPAYLYVQYFEENQFRFRAGVANLGLFLFGLVLLGGSILFMRPQWIRPEARPPRTPQATPAAAITPAAPPAMVPQGGVAATPMISGPTAPSPAVPAAIIADPAESSPLTLVQLPPPTGSTQVAPAVQEPTGVPAPPSTGRSGQGQADQPKFGLSAPRIRR